MWRIRVPCRFRFGGRFHLVGGGWGWFLGVIRGLGCFGGRFRRVLRFGFSILRLLLLRAGHVRQVQCCQQRGDIAAHVEFNAWLENNKLINLYFLYNNFCAINRKMNSHQNFGARWFCKLSWPKLVWPRLHLACLLFASCATLDRS